MPRTTVEVRGLGGEEALRPGGFEWREALGIMAREGHLNRWFKHIANHLDDCDVRRMGVGDIPRRACLVFCLIHFFPLAVGDPIRLVAPEELGLEFYEVCWRPGEQLVPSIPIFVNDRLAGMYLPEHETFLLSDWTHTNLGARVGARLMEQLIEIVGLEPLPPPDESAGIKPVKVTVGCDPEFELVRIGVEPVFVAACNVISEPGGGGGELGVDGAGTPIEVRPRASEDPAEVVRSIRSIFERFARRYPTYDGSPVGEKHPVGGHIHIGVGRPWDPPMEVVQVLDDFIGRSFKKLNGPARCDDSFYGRLGDVRTQPHGFEYRTPPAAIFAEPRVAEIVLKLARNLVDRVLNSPPSEVIRYSRPPTVADYVNVGGLTREEVRYLNTIVRQWKTAGVPRSIRWGWGLPEPEPAELEVRFGDDWAEDAWRYYQNQLLAQAQERGIGRGIVLYLYGLGASRGEVATIAIEGFEVLVPPPIDPHPQPGHYAVGLPRVARVEPTWREHADRVIEAILDYLSCVEEGA